MTTTEHPSLEVLQSIIGLPTGNEIHPTPFLFCTALNLDEAMQYDPELKSAGSWYLRTLGFGYLTDELLRYPFVVENTIDGELYIGTTKDDVFCVPYDFVTRVLEQSIFSPVPTVFNAREFYRVKYKISGGDLYVETKPNSVDAWKKTNTYDERINNADITAALSH